MHGDPSRRYAFAEGYQGLVEHGHGPYRGLGMQWEVEVVHSLGNEQSNGSADWAKFFINTTTYRSQQRQPDILQRSSAGVAVRQAERPKQAVEGDAGEAADPGEGKVQDRGHYLVGWS